MDLVCAQCSTTAAVSAESGHTVAKNGIVVTLERRPVLRCPNGHVTTPAIALPHARAVVRKRITTARAHWRGGERCRACKQTLTMPSRWTQIPLTLETPLVVTLLCEVPASRCPNCGTDQLSVRAADDLDAALVTLFDA